MTKLHQQPPSKFAKRTTHRFKGDLSTETCELCGQRRALHEDDGFVPNREPTHVERQFWQEARASWRKPGSEERE